MREKFHYDSENGILYRRFSTNLKPCFSKQTLGYLKVTIQDGGSDASPNRYSTLVHRVCWYLYYGNWPSEIDHINRNKTDNRISNLRLATRAQNKANEEKTRRRTSSKYKGVSYYKTPSNAKKPWRAQVSGYPARFSATEEEAAKNYDIMAREKYGEFAVLNFPEEFL